MAPSASHQITILACACILLPAAALDLFAPRNPLFPGVDRPGRAGFRLPGASTALPVAPAAGPLPTLQPFPLSDVSLAPGSDFAANQGLNHAYLLSLDVDSLLFSFRTTAGLPAPGAAYGGWEGPDVEVRGQFVGHYLSALAFAYKSTGDEAFKARGDEVVAGLAACQAALGTGYLSAFPASHFDRLEALEPVWAPYYVIHKLLQGLLDQHALAGQGDALGALRAAAAYHCDRSRAVFEAQGADHWHQVLETEFGGMEDTLYAVFQATGEVRWASCAALFVKPNWFHPLAAGADVLAGRHANTHLAQVLGFAARFDATGHPASAAAVAHFFTSVTGNHSFSTGGSNWWEGWGQPASLGTPLSDPRAAANTQESCTTYNVLKIARALFRWTGRPQLADFYERALLNGVLGVQRHGAGHGGHEGHAGHGHTHAAAAAGGAAPPALLRPSAADRAAIAASNAVHAAHPRPADPRTVTWPDDPAAAAAGDDPDRPGQFIYYMPLGAGDSKGDNPGAWTQGFGSPFNSFWCCYGTAIESFSKLADSIYFFFTPPAPAPQTLFYDLQAGLISRLRRAWPARLGGLLPRPPPPRPPALFLNQLVSSTLQWRAMGVTLRQTADLYGDAAGDNVATSVLEIGVEPPPSAAGEDNGGSGARPRRARFFLHFRFPSWVNNSAPPDLQAPGGPELRLNGRRLDLATLPRAGGAPGPLPALRDFSPPAFGKDADYVVLGPEWADGDVLEARLPMAVVVEDLNDARIEMQTLKAVTMGPFVMAGITEGDRGLDLAPEEVPAALRPPGAAAELVSLAPAAAGAGATSPSALLQHVGGWRMGFGPVGAARRARPAAMAATFRAVSVAAVDPGTVCAGANQRILGPSALLFVLESMAWPGRRLAADPSSGRLFLRPEAGEGAAPPLVFYIPALTSEDGGAGAPAVAVGGCGGSGRAAPPPLRLAPPAAEGYPKGARILAGKTKKYLVAPLGQLIDERYTPYFDFSAAAPSAAAA